VTVAPTFTVRLAGTNLLLCTLTPLAGAAASAVLPLDEVDDESLPQAESSEAEARTNAIRGLFTSNPIVRVLRASPPLTRRRQDRPQGPPARGRSRMMGRSTSRNIIIAADPETRNEATRSRVYGLM
jgi:hypothetical protein